MSRVCQSTVGGCINNKLEELLPDDLQHSLLNNSSVRVLKQNIISEIQTAESVKIS